MQVEHISTIDRLIATQQIAEMAGQELISQNLEIAIDELQSLKESFKNNIMFFHRCPGKSEFNKVAQKIMESTFTCKRKIEPNAGVIKSVRLPLSQMIKQKLKEIE